MRRSPEPLSVGRLLNLLKQAVGRAFPTLLVSGEVLDPLVSSRGHLYLKLTDGQAEIRAVMWKREVDRLSRIPQAGDQVTVRGSLDLYAPRGDLQLQIAALMQSGRGQKMLQLAELKKKLRSEGLFDRPRKPLPRIPRCIGVVTSVGSAVIHDIFQSVRKRFPATQVILSPASVGGPQAAQEVMEALDRFGPEVEVVLICRGGGSFEELLPFSDERLVRKVACYTRPVVAAVGHGSDSTLLDLVADHTAPTPTSAAVLATPDGEELQHSLVRYRERLKQALKGRLKGRRKQLAGLTAHCRSHHPGLKVSRKLEQLSHLIVRAGSAVQTNMRLTRGELDSKSFRLERALPLKKAQDARRQLQKAELSLIRSVSRRLSRKERELQDLRTRLLASGPQAVLERGYAFVQSQEGLVTSCQGRTPGEELELHLADGRLIVEVKTVVERSTS